MGRRRSFAKALWQGVLASPAQMLESFDDRFDPKVRGQDRPSPPSAQGEPDLSSWRRRVRGDSSTAAKRCPPWLSNVSSYSGSRFYDHPLLQLVRKGLPAGGRLGRCGPYRLETAWAAFHCGAPGRRRSCRVTRPAAAGVQLLRDCRARTRRARVPLPRGQGPRSETSCPGLLPAYTFPTAFCSQGLILGAGATSGFFHGDHNLALLP